MTFALHGFGITDKIIIGRAVIQSDIYSAVERKRINKSNIKNECERFKRAVNQVKKNLLSLKENSSQNMPTELSNFVDLYHTILGDPVLNKDTISKIKKLSCNAEWALKTQYEIIDEQFKTIKDDFFKEKRADIYQVVLKILTKLQNKNNSKKVNIKNKILVTEDLSPTELISLKNLGLKGFISEKGGPTSHTGILAKSLDMPAVLALHSFDSIIKDNDILIVDSNSGVVIVNPHKIIINQYKKTITECLKTKNEKKYLKRKCISKDKVRINIMSNIEFTKDAEISKDIGSNGIGLFRTEYLFLRKDSMPSEEDQFQEYKKLGLITSKQPIIIRTLDIGLSNLQFYKKKIIENNPALGLRAIRLSLAQPKIYQEQISAILRASIYGDYKILLPMITSKDELLSAREIIKNVMTDLKEKGIKYNEKIEIGAMIETPAIALAISSISDHVDFISVGTNDLLQYSLAIDRDNDEVSYLHNPIHPGIINLLNIIIENAKKNALPLIICGEMAGDLKLTRLLLGMGITNFSTNNSKISKLKKIIINSHIYKYKEISSKILKNIKNEQFINQSVEKMNSQIT